MTGYLDLFIDLLMFCAGLLVIVWVGLQSSRRKSASGWPPAAVMAMLAWIAVFAFSLYLVFG